MSSKLYEIPVKHIDNSDTTLNEYNGKVLLLVNVASECGLTPQYKGLQELYDKYKEQGLEILGFPANEFGAQEPGSNEEIKQFCDTRFRVKFPLFSKIVVKGEGQHPLYQYLTNTKPEAKVKPNGTLKTLLAEEGLVTGEPHDILWNFEKFLVNRKGEVVERFAPDVEPEDEQLVNAIESELKK